MRAGLYVVCGTVILGCVRPKPVVVTAPPRVVVGNRTDAPTPHPAAGWSGEFWHAMGALDFINAWTVATSREQRQLVDALQSMTEGRDGEADTALTALLTTQDTLVRNAARLTYGALLSSRSQWRRLSDFARSTRGGEYDAAGVEAWASSFADATSSIRFDDSVVTLPLTRSPSGAPVIPVRINGVTRYFWLDTGSSITIISSVAAGVCGVTPRGSDTLELLTAAGRIPARPAIVRSIRIGGMAVESTPGMIVDAEALTLRSSGYNTTGAVESHDSHVDGVIGFDLIRALDLTIDDVRGLVIVRRPARQPAARRRPRNLLWFGIPIVTLMAENGTRMYLSLDTGAEETYGTRTLATKTGTRAVSAERRRVHGFGGTSAERGVLIRRIRLFLDDVPLVFERVFLYRAAYPTLFQLDGTLGADAGRGSVVRIDMTNGRIELGRGDR